MKYPRNFQYLIMTGVLSVLLLSGCLTKDYVKDMTTLGEIVELYNRKFQSKASQGGAEYVLENRRADYYAKLPEVQDRVTFYEANILKIDFMLDGKPVANPEDLEDQDIKEAQVTIRYELVVTPSASLKRKVMKQKWMKVGGGWFLDPDLETFLQP